MSTECKLTCDFEILRHSPIFSGADNEVIRLFAYLAKRKKYQPGDLLIDNGKEADMAFYLISGNAEVTTFHQNKEVLLQQLSPGTFCGELALLARFNWFFTVRATEETEAIIISRESFQKVLEKFPEKRDRLIERIVQLRVQRLVEQTTFMLDKLPESLLSECIWSPSKLSL